MGHFDFNIIQHNTYDHYVRAHTKIDDYRYLGNRKVIHKLLRLGYRKPLVDADEFYSMKNAYLESINQESERSHLFSNHLVGDDPALVALANREERNMLKKISTIIFLQVRLRNGFDINGYIDFENSLRDCLNRKLGAVNWTDIFMGRSLLRPRRTDLSFFDWHSNQLCYNRSDNYDIVLAGSLLMFKHTGDHKFVPVTTKECQFKENVKRTFITSPMYGNMILYDHIVRKAS